MECKVTEERIARWIWEKLLVGVVNETKRGPTNPKRVRGLAKIN
jgi:hypothetical protein